MPSEAQETKGDLAGLAHDNRPYLDRPGPGALYEELAEHLADGTSTPHRPGPSTLQPAQAAQKDYLEDAAKKRQEEMLSLAIRAHRNALAEINQIPAVDGSSSCASPSPTPAQRTSF